MPKLLMLFSGFCFVCLVLFDQQITVEAGDSSLEYYVELPDEEPLVSTESNLISNHTISSENTTEIDSIANTTESSTHDDDVIVLNVGGQMIATLRSTLTAVPESKLALMFRKQNGSIQQSRDMMGTVFFDYNPAHFSYLLDQLRMIKRTPGKLPYEINIEAPKTDSRGNFSLMISDLGLNPERFLSPLLGAYLNLSINSLLGWRECYRDNYDRPYDPFIFPFFCRRGRLLVACKRADDDNFLTVAGVGKWEDLLHQCSPNSQCTPEIKNGTGFYYVKDQAWGFEGRPKDVVSNINANQYRHLGHYQNSFQLSPCDTSNQYPEYRLCWSIRSSTNRGGGDRCGSMTNLHNSDSWERIIYEAV